MYSIAKHLLSIGTFAGALVLTASLASAQRASFTLPFEAHFGRVTLQPGEYRLRVSPSPSSIREIYLEGNGKVQATLPIAVDTGAIAEGGHLQFVNIGGTYFADKFVSATTGMSYQFGIPKTVRREILANARATTVSVATGASN